jgi:hypothetical protein
VERMASVTVPVVPAEDNILPKAVWERGPERSKHNWQDVEAMMAHQPALDGEHLHWRGSSLAPPARYSRHSIDGREAGEGLSEIEQGPCGHRR